MVLGHDRIAAAFANLGMRVSDQTVGNVLQRHRSPPAPERKHTTTWGDIHSGSPGGAGGDRLLHGGGPHAAGEQATYYAVVFIDLESRKVDIAGITVHPNQRRTAANGPERYHEPHPPPLSLSPA